MRHIRILPALIITAMFVACQVNNLDGEPEEVKGFGYPVTEDVEGGKITYQYNDEVIVLNRATQKYLVKVEADTILYFSESTPERLLPYKGGIISSAVVDDKTPYGLGNRVISVSQENGLYKCVTTAASLDEIFKELTLAADIMLVTDAIPSQVEDVDGNLHDVTVSKFSETKAEIGSPNVLTVELDGLSGKNAGAYVDGKVSLGAVLSVDFERSKDRYDCSLSLYAGFDGEIGVKTQCEGYKKLLPKDKLPILNGEIPFGPIVLRPFVDAELGLEGEAEGSISTGLSKVFGAKFGMKNRKSFYENLTEPDAKIIKDISVDVKGEVALVTKLYFGMGLYTKNIAVSIDPTISVGLSTDFKVNNENLFKNNPTLDFDIKAEAKGALYAQFFGKELFREEMNFVSLNLFNYSWPLLPSLVENSLNVTKRDAGGPLTFDAEYSLTGDGLLGKLDFPLYPAFKVYKGSELVDVVSSAENISGEAAQKFTFELAGLEDEVSYIGKPCLVIGDKSYDEDGVAFSSSYKLCPDDHHPHMIDLGLPSGTKWACCNVGADAPNKLGGRYAWGETWTKAVYNLGTYEFCIVLENGLTYVGDDTDGVYFIFEDGVGYFFKYNDICYDICGTKYDVARVKWGNTWRMPTRLEFQELLDHCIRKPYTLKGTSGYIFTGPNGNSIFMPDAEIYQSGDGWPSSPVVLSNCRHMDSLTIVGAAEGGYVRPVAD